MAFLLGCLCQERYLAGPKRLCEDFQVMMEERPLCHLRWKVLQWYFIITWMAIFPLMLVVSDNFTTIHNLTMFT